MKPEILKLATAGYTEQPPLERHCLWLGLLNQQESLNNAINPHWYLESPDHYDFAFAALHEAVELCEHLDYPWWRNKTPDIEQARLEYVDMLHFWLSVELTAFGKMYLCDTYGFDADGTPVAQLALPTRHDLIEANATVRVERAITHGKAFAKHVGLFSLQRAHNELREWLRNARRILHHLAHALVLDEDTIVTLYYAKSVLNQFRQDHGYKAGTYRKRWLNRDGDMGSHETFEDNEALMAFVKALLSQGQALTTYRQAYETLYSPLAVAYGYYRSGDTK